MTTFAGLPWPCAENESNHQQTDHGKDRHPNHSVGAEFQCGHKPTLMPDEAQIVQRAERQLWALTDDKATLMFRSGAYAIYLRTFTSFARHRRLALADDLVRVALDVVSDL